MAGLCPPWYPMFLDKLEWLLFITSFVTAIHSCWTFGIVCCWLRTLCGRFMTGSADLWSLLWATGFCYVFIIVQPLALLLLLRLSLRRGFFGHYQIIERVGAVAYRLCLPPQARNHDVFRVALLKKYVGVPPGDLVPLPRGGSRILIH